MADGDDIAAGLPAPRDDEPDALRQDIADELADHLRCAIARERLRDENLRGRDEAETLRAAIERFGDPATIARRLWWDAMKERILIQWAKLCLAAVIGAVATLCLVFMLQMSRNNRALEKALEAKEQAVQAMLAKVQTPPQAVAAAAWDEANNWFPLRVKLVDEAGQPVKGRVFLNGVLGSSPLTQSASTASGIADFGRLPSGQYSASAESMGAVAEVGTVLIGPGRPNELTLICPSESAERHPLRIEIAPPEDLDSKRILYLAKIVLRAQQADDRIWKNTDDRSAVFLLLDNAGTPLGEMSRSDAEQVHGSLMPIESNVVATDPTTQTAPAVSPFSGMFVDAIGPDIPLSQPHGFLAGAYQLTLVPYAAEDAAPVDGRRPALRRIEPVALIRPFQFVDGEPAICRIDAKEGVFWDSIKHALQPPAADGSVLPYRSPENRAPCD